MKHTLQIRFASLALVFAILVSSLTGLLAKDIVKNASSKKSANSLIIRTDGLACYFCAYGLERSFKKSGKIAAWDMNMGEGIVEATLIKGAPFLSVETVSGYVYDAGFTFRWMKAVLVGRIEKKDGEFVFNLSETGEQLPLQSNAALDKIQDDKNLIGIEIEIVADVVEAKNAPMGLAIINAKPWEAKLWSNPED